MFNKREFLKSVIHGIGTSFILFFIAYGSFNNAVTPEGTNLVCNQLVATEIYTNLVLVVTSQVN